MRKAIAILLVMFSAAMVSAQAAKSATKTAAPAKHAVMSKDEAAIKDLYERWAKAFHNRDLDGIMAFYAPGDALVAYDIVPPLQYRGYDAYRKDYQEFLGMFSGPIDVEYRDMRVYAGGDVGFVHTLERISGPTKNGQMAVWLRATSGVRRINGKWLIVHDHISVPVAMESGKALMDLKP